MCCRFDDYRGPIRNIIGEDPNSPLTPVWGLNYEGELRTAWREVGVPNVWYMMGQCDDAAVMCSLLIPLYAGNLAWARFFSKHVALRRSYH